MTDRECNLCNEGRLISCSDTIELKSLWYCTREPGHEGKHIACAVDDHNIHSWGQDCCAPDLKWNAVIQEYTADVPVCMDKHVNHVCTREKGHSGDHIACSISPNDCRINRWENLSSDEAYTDIEPDPLLPSKWDITLWKFDT